MRSLPFREFQEIGPDCHGREREGFAGLWSWRVAESDYPQGRHAEPSVRRNLQQDPVRPDLEESRPALANFYADAVNVRGDAARLVERRATTVHCREVHPFQ